MSRRQVEGYLESIDPLLLQPQYPVFAPGVLLGRDAEQCEVILSHDYVSRKHCSIGVEGDKVILTDLEAMNGTFVNGNRITRHELQEGDRIALGRATPHHFVFTGQPRPRQRRYILPTQTLYRIGRAADNDLPLQSDPTVSNLHARLRIQGDKMLVEDAGSANSTFVNDMPVRVAAIGPNDVVRIGSCELSFQSAPEGLLVVSREKRNQVRLEARNVLRLHKGRQLLRDISLVIEPGEYVGVLGPSGAGKSTLLNALNGFAPANGGDVLLNDRSLYTNYDMFRNAIGFVPQDDIIHRELTVERSLLYTAQLRLPKDTTREQLNQHVTSVIETLGLTHVRQNPVEQLSGGQRKRVSIGCELLTRPSLIFLDEPTSGLDPSTEEKLMKHFRLMTEQGQSVIITTHILYNLGLLDLVVLLARGRLVYFGPVADVCPFFSTPEHQITRPIEVFDLLEPETTDSSIREQRAEFFEKKYKESELYQRYVAARIAKHGTPLPGDTLSATAANSDSKAATSAKAKPRRIRGFLRGVLNPRQLAILTRRMFDLKLAFPARLAVPLITPIILALLTSTIHIDDQKVLDQKRSDYETLNRDALHALDNPPSLPGGPPPPKPLMSSSELLQMKYQGFQGMAIPLSLALTLVMTAVFLGTLSACLEISGERSIYMRERAVNLSIPTYVASKLPALFLLSALQCFLYVGIAAALLGLSEVNILALVLIAIGVSWVSACIGLFISSLDPTPGQNSVVLAVIAVLPQMIFSGALGPSFYGGMGNIQWLADALPARWGFELMLTEIYQKPEWARNVITGVAQDPDPLKAGMGFKFGDVVYAQNLTALTALAAAYFVATCVSLRRYDKL